MKVILLAKIAGLGHPDDIREVADGYAVNYLFPRHLAVQASEKAVKSLGVAKSKKAKILERDLVEQQTLASQLDGLTISIKEKTNEAGLFYASIGPQKIFDALKKLELEVEKNNIIAKAIKEVGEYDVLVKLRHGLEAKIHLIALKLE